MEIPYRAILPQKVEGLLAPGRHLSTDDRAIDWLNLIPQCVGTGQGAGVAAAVAVMDGTTTHHVDIKKVQDILVDQNVPLPRNAKFEAKDPSYRELDVYKRQLIYIVSVVFHVNFDQICDFLFIVDDKDFFIHCYVPLFF